LQQKLLAAMPHKYIYATVDVKIHWFIQESNGWEMAK